MEMTFHEGTHPSNKTGLPAPHWALLWQLEAKPFSLKKLHSLWKEGCLPLPGRKAI